MQYEQIFAFSGINRQVSPFLPKDGEIYEGRNLITEKIGVLKKTGDYEIKWAQIVAAQDILGGIDFQRVSGTHTHVVACDGASNAEIYVDSGSAWGTQSQSLTKNNKVRFAYSPTLDYLFATNYADDTRGYTGAAWSTATNLTNAPKAKVPILFGRRLYLLNCVIGATSYRTRAYRSSLVDSGSITWDTTNDWLVFDDIIVGGALNGENMFVGCENSCWIFTKEGAKYRISTKGCTSHEGIAQHGKWTFWPSRDGYMAYNGANEIKISLPIDDYWKGISEANLAKIQADVVGDYLYLYVGDLTAPDTFSNVMFVYDILGNDWNKLELGEEVENLHTYVTTTGKKLFMGNDDGEVFKMFSSETQNTVAFPSGFETNWIYGSGRRIIDDWYELWGYGNKLSGLKVSCKVDDGEWKSVGELNGSTDVCKFKARGYRIKFLLQEVSKNNLYEIYSLDAGYEPAYEKEKDTEE